MASLGIGELELSALLVVARQGNDAYGAAIRRELSAQARRDYSVGAIYATLQRLEDKGLLKSSMSEPTPVRGGRSRRYYRLTAAGSRKLTDARAATEARWQGFRLPLRTT